MVRLSAEILLEAHNLFNMHWFSELLPVFRKEGQ